MHTPQTVHVDYNPEHRAMTFDDTNGEPILSYRTMCTIKGGRGPDGWVLDFIEPDGNGVEDFVTGIQELTAVDQAVAAAQQFLARRNEAL